MNVTADQVASIRALLTRDIETYQRMSEQLDPANKEARGALIAAAFYTAARQRFKGGTPANVAAFVNDLRMRRGLAEEVDSRVAERLLLATFTDEDIEDIDGDSQGDHFGILLAGLIADAQLSGSELDAFLEDSRNLADEWLTEGN